MIEMECLCCRERTKADAPGGDRASAVRAAGIGAGHLPGHGQFLSKDRACAALGEMFGCAPSPAALAAQARKIAARRSRCPSCSPGVMTTPGQSAPVLPSGCRHEGSRMVRRLR